MCACMSVYLLYSYNVYYSFLTILVQCWDRSAGIFFLLLTYFEFTENTTNYFESMLLSVEHNINEFDILIHA